MKKTSNSNRKKELNKYSISKFIKVFLNKEDNNPKRKALKITYIYFIIGSLWILLSDKLVGILFKDPGTIIFIGIIKGWVYVFITALIIFIRIFNGMKEVVDSKEKMQYINAILKEEIQEKTQIENELNKEKNFMEAIFNSVPGIVYLCDDKSNLVRWNKKHIEMTGFSDKELSGMSF